MDSAAPKTDDLRDNANVIEIIGGDNHPIYEEIQIQSPKSRNEPPIMETRNIPSQGYLMEMNQSMEIHRSQKDRHCKMFYTEIGCIYGDQCGFVHDEQSRTRERNAIILSPQSPVGFGNGLAPWNGIAPGNGIAPWNGGLPSSSPFGKSPNWRTKICNKWESGGFCPFGSRCTFAHGTAELQRYGGGPLHQVANPNNQQHMSPNIVASSGSSMAHAVGPSSSSRAGGSGSGQLPGTIKKPWKGPKKINRIYGDWIDDLE